MGINQGMDHDRNKNLHEESFHMNGKDGHSGFIVGKQSLWFIPLKKWKADRYRFGTKNHYKYIVCGNAA